MADIKYLQSVGDGMHLVYDDGTRKAALPNGSGIYIVQGFTAPGPVDPPPVETPPATGDWVHPLGGSAMTSPFGPRGFDGVASYHYGADFSTGGGGVIVAPTDLVVTIARANWGLGGSAGNCVKAHTTNESHTFNFYHMADGSINVAEGSTIKRGTRIGIEGETGNAYGAHLHFEVYQGKWNDPWPPPYNNGANVIDPVPLLQSHGVVI